MICQEKILMKTCFLMLKFPENPFKRCINLSSPDVKLLNKTNENLKKKKLIQEKFLIIFDVSGIQFKMKFVINLAVKWQNGEKN